MQSIQSETNTTPGPLLAPGEVLEPEIDVLAILISLLRHKRVIFYSTAAAAILGSAVALFIPNRYTATTKILPPQQTQSSASMVLSQIAGSGTLASLAGKDL